MKLSKGVWSLLLAGLLVASTAPVGATTLNPVNADQLVRDAALIIQGVVTSVEYRNSDVGSDEYIALPHTFVTFQIERFFKGSSADGNTITLRLQGGPDGQGNAMLIPGVPLFDVGDRDILFIRGNGSEIAPLVGWEQGRLRIIKGKVYSEAGEEVWLTREGEFTLGKHVALEEVITHNLGGTAIELGTSNYGKEWAPPAGARRLDAADFANFITAKVKQAASAMQKLVPEPSAYIQDKFYVARPSTLAPPALPAAAPSSQVNGQPDPVEEELLQKNGGSPVLGGPTSSAIEAPKTSEP